MSAIFSALGIAGSGLDAMQVWLNTSGGNVANANDTAPTSKGTYAPETTVLTPSSGAPGSDGLGVSASVALGSNAGQIVYDPSSPLADAKGNIRMTSVSLSHELVNLIQAQEGYQADTSTLQKAIAAYQSGLTIGS